MFTSQLCKSFICSSICICNTNSSDSEDHVQQPLLSSTLPPPPAAPTSPPGPAMPVPIPNTYGRSRKAYGIYDDNFSQEHNVLTPINDVDAELISHLSTGFGRLEIEESIASNPNSLVQKHLKPITDAYFKDSNQKLRIETWKTIFGSDDKLEKIAEASFAEVYRFKTISEGDSILKIMNLKIPTDVESLERDTSILIEDVVPEIRIMHALAVVPGFVAFKAAHLIKGRTPKIVNKAYDKHLSQLDEDLGSYFPHPLQYGSDSVFLVIELGNAGTVLEHLEITDTTQVYDILIGVTLALARAELSHEFEHRDLHENNICYYIKDSADAQNPPPGVKFGRSGIEITIIDYGLSRAKMENGEIIYNDLERDLAVFQSESQSVDKQQKALEKLQFDTYRMMRHYLYTGVVKSTSKSWHTANKAVKQGTGHNSWEAYIPLTNVFWIRYLLRWLTNSLPNNSDHQNFFSEIAEFEKKLRSQRGSPFNNAMEVLEYFLKKGWISDEQLDVDGEDSILSQELSRIGGDGAEEADSEIVDGDDNDDEDNSDSKNDEESSDDD